MNITCDICLDLFTPKDAIVTAGSCGHCFHFNCLETWRKRSQTCPKCRSKCSKKDPIKLYLNVEAADDKDGEKDEKIKNLEAKIQKSEEKYNHISKWYKAETKLLKAQNKLLKQSEKLELERRKLLDLEVLEKDKIIRSLKSEKEKQKRGDKRALERSDENENNENQSMVWKMMRLTNGSSYIYMQKNVN